MGGIVTKRKANTNNGEEKEILRKGKNSREDTVF